jgi:hypothetical protein
VRTDKIIKMTSLNSGIVIVNIILFSPGLVGIQMGGSSVFSTALGITSILMSVVIFGYGNYKLLGEKEKIIETSKIKTTEDFVYALEQNFSKKTFGEDINIILTQIKRLQKKKETINDILLQRFGATEMSYSKFNNVILDAENVFYINIRSIINKLNAFDEDEYKSIKNDAIQKNFSEGFLKEKIDIYNEYISFVKNSIEDNEQIILKLDKLLLEISKLNSLEEGDIESMSAMKEIDELIANTKLYK